MTKINPILFMIGSLVFCSSVSVNAQANLQTGEIQDQSGNAVSEANKVTTPTGGTANHSEKPINSFENNEPVQASHHTEAVTEGNKREKRERVEQLKIRERISNGHH